MCMALDTRLLLWSTMLKDTLHMQRMPYLHREWVYNLGVDKHTFVMAGICTIARRWSSPWFSHPTILIFQTSQRAWNKCLLNVGYGLPVSECNVKIASMVQHLAVQSASWICSLTSRNSTHWWKRSLHRLATCVSFFPNSTVSSILLSFSRVQWRNIFRIIVITLSQPCRKICRQHLHQWNSALFGSGSIGWFDGWKHTGLALG